MPSLEPKQKERPPWRWEGGGMQHKEASVSCFFVSGLEYLVKSPFLWVRCNLTKVVLPRDQPSFTSTPCVSHAGDPLRLFKIDQFKAKKMKGPFCLLFLCLVPWN